jgi:predicted RNA-binding Zn-ribbon protein involved in translation (DUF1610 family)
MPFIIWGSRGLTSNKGHGKFYCPSCDEDDVNYDHKSVREWFTVYFIPIFPIGSAKHYVECQYCKNTFKESVLEMEPPSPAERLFSGTGEALRQGMSIREAEKQLKEHGLTEEQARLTINGSAGEGRWTCPKCGEQYHFKVRKCAACDGSH